MPDVSLPFTPVIIIGAARSGTNMLRDMLTAMPGFATWPCDEINPVWRHSNRSWPDDEIPVGLAENGRRYIRASFARRWRHAGRCPFIVEKTCANTLRVLFVAAVLPEARFVQIIRDGADVVPSAEKRWRGALELNAPQYFLAKARFTPLADLPSIGLKFVRDRVPRLLGRSERLRIWGPRVAGMEALHCQPLSDICARQWVACVQRSDAALASMPGKTWLRLRYEDIVAAPVDALRAVTAFLDAGRSACGDISAAAAIASPKMSQRIRKTELGWRTEAILRPMRQRHGYVV